MRFADEQVLSRACDRARHPTPLVRHCLREPLRRTGGGWTMCGYRPVKRGGGGATMAHGAVVSLWRYPVKSMMGEELNASDVTDRGLLGDRSLALIDTETGKVVSAKNPKKWSTMFDFRAAFSEPPQQGEPLPAVRVTLPDGGSVTSDDGRFADVMSTVPATPF